MLFIWDFVLVLEDGKTIFYTPRTPGTGKCKGKADGAAKGKAEEAAQGASSSTAVAA